MQALCLYKRVSHLTSDQTVCPTIQKALEAAISCANYLDSIGYLNTLLALVQDRETLARCRVRLAIAVAQGGPSLGRRRTQRPVAIVRGRRVRRADLSSSDDIWSDPEAESAEDDEHSKLAYSSVWTEF